MFNTSTFTSSEVVPFYGLLATVVAIVVYGYLKDYKIFWSPLTVMAVIFLYYCVLGPYEAVTSGMTYDRLVNMRKFYPSALWGAWISLISISIGFLIAGDGQKIFKPVPKISDENLFLYGRRILLVGTSLFALSTGGNVLGLVNPFDAEGIQQSTGSLSNYMFLSVNFLIPGISLLFIYWYRTKKQLLWFLIPCILCLGVYVSIGFRYRVVLLLGSLAITYYLSARKRPNIIIAPVIIALFIVAMGIINVSRHYGHGLDPNKLEGGNTTSYYKSGMRESMIFQTSGAVIDIVPKRHPHVYFAPIVSTIFFPIPQRLYEGKNSAWYVISILKTIYGNENFKGGAYMAYAEQYLAFGWGGIVAFGLLLGWLYKKLWGWFLQHLDNPFVIVAYSCTITYSYVILSRGYLPQVTMLFFFSAFPAFFVIWMIRRRIRATGMVRTPA